MKKYKILLILVPIFLFSCVTIPKINWNNPNETQKRVTITHDNFEKIIEYKGPNALCNYSRVGSCDGYFAGNVFIRAWKYIKTNSVSYQIYIKDLVYDDWKYYDTAYDSDGNELDTTVISRDVDSCNARGCELYEHIGINISRDYLVEHITSGIQLQLSGKAGKDTFSITGAYIKGFLTKIDM
ncbi:MAG: hypothetical protein FE834_05490 [Gammaproteobacteria bacterium]|nr:hypothetical protein [Gammaproteobacteria bacterium]